MEIKYKLETMIMKNGRPYAYKVYAGVYIFYLSQKVFSGAVNSGLIEYDGTEKSLKYNDIIRFKGEEAAERLKYAVANTTVEYLTEELEVVNEMPPIVFLHYNFGNIRLAAVSLMVKSCTVDIKTTSILRGGTVNEQLAELNKAVTEGYTGVLNYIANYCDKEFGNSHNLLRSVREYNRKKLGMPGGYHITLGY